MNKTNNSRHFYVFDPKTYIILAECHKANTPKQAAQYFFVVVLETLKKIKYYSNN